MIRKIIKQQGDYLLTESSEFYEIFRNDEFLTCYDLDELKEAEKDFENLTGLGEVTENDNGN